MTDAYVTEQKPDHHYRTETPNIIWDLGLKVYARDLYSYYKKVAGDGGYCCTSSATIQKVLGMSPNTVNKYRKILEQPFDLLGGKPLIIATERLTEYGDPDTVHVEIVDIWRENGDNERRKAKERAKKQNRGTARGEGGVPHEMREGTSRDAYKEEPLKKNLIKNPYGSIGDKPPHAPQKPPIRDKKIQRAEHVSTTDDEHEKLIAEHGEAFVAKCYLRLSEWKLDTARTKWKKCDNRTIRRWVVEAVKEDASGGGSKRSRANGGLTPDKQEAYEELF